MSGTRRHPERGARIVMGAVLVVAGVVALGSTTSGYAGTPGCSNAQVLHHWAVRRLAEQTVVVPVEENHLHRVAREVQDGAGGVILFGSSAPADLAARLHRLTSLAPGGLAPLVMTDEEGGAVQRMANLVGAVPSAREMGATMGPTRIRRLARRLATRMAAAGVDADLAPVLDLDGRAGPNASDAIGTRSFSPRPRVATRDGLAFAHGLRAGGIVPVVKHFPGIGAADGNTDLGAASTPPWSDVRSHDLRPFAAAVAAGLPVVMVSNARVPGLSDGPASLSRAAVGRVLRRRLGFHGLVIPDSLTAGAVAAAGYGVARAGVRGLRVGEDMVLFGGRAPKVAGRARRVVAALVAAVGSGTLARGRLEEAVTHVLAAKHVDLCSTRSG